MAIIFDEIEKTFTLHTKGTTYQMQIDKYGFLIHLYYGRRALGSMSYLLTYTDRGFSGNPYDAEQDRTYSLDVLPQEFPCQGTGDYRSTALVVQNIDGSFGADIRYKSHNIIKGKYSLQGLPVVHASQEEAETLEVVMVDTNTDLQVILLYGVLEDQDIITRSVQIVNGGDGEIFIKKAYTACLDFVNGDFDMISFYGRHAMERNFQRIPVNHGNYTIGSRRGTSSHQYSPMLLLADKETTEDAGSCYALSFVYSGGFKVEAERDQFNQTRVLMGLSQEQFSYPLKEGETFIMPEVILSFTHQGLNQLSQNLHRCIRHNVCRGKYQTEIRPVLVNSWEASYFEFTGESIYRLAQKAKEAGLDMLVLDDGWFGKREDDNSSLGDWKVNEKKLGSTLGQFIQNINRIGVKFGIWAEPEMVSEDSDLFRQHPDWALCIPGRNPVRARNQLVLDFSRKEVVDYVFKQICKVLDQGNIEYLKWDMNRSLSDVYSAATQEQGRVMYDYVLGLYDFLERLTLRYPNLLLEGCSGGGGRFDAGMLYYTPQIWCSDNTDAVDRIRIQYGTSFGFPISAVGSHVSACPNHQTGRSVSMNTRAVVAMAGSFGYELDLCALSREELQEIKRQVEEYKRYAPLIHDGRYYRLSNPFVEDVGAWSFVSQERDAVLLQIVMLENHGNMTTCYVKLRGLKEEAMYREEQSGRCMSGSALMECGIPLPKPTVDYEAGQMYFREIK